MIQKKLLKKNINNAYCPIGVAKDNSILQLTKFIVFPIKNKIKIERDKKFGGDILFNDYSRLEKSFTNKELHPSDLKNSLSKELINIFAKVRTYFEKNQDLIPKN